MEYCGNPMCPNCSQRRQRDPAEFTAARRDAERRLTAALAPPPKHATRADTPPDGMPPEKWVRMNRAQRRAWRRR